MVKLNLTLWTALYLLSSFNIATGQAKNEKITRENVWSRNRIDSTMKANNIPAVSFGIIRNGKLVYCGGVGVISRGSKTEVNENTIYQIGSDTKKFTGIIVNNLIKEGKLNTDSPITRYLPELTSEARQRLSRITLNHLLIHKSGIPNRAPSDPRVDGDPMVIEYQAQNLVKDLNEIKPEFEPGTKFGYSNLGYAVAGYICEQVTGMYYRDLLKKYITGKYNLKNTFIYPDQEHKAVMATPYRKDNREIETQPFRMGKLAPAGGICSSIMDLSVLMMKQIEEYNNFLKRGKSCSPLILTSKDSVKNAHYGFGLAQNADRKGVHYGHGGDLDGFASGYVFMPEKKLGLILLTSSGGRWFGKLEKDLLNRLASDD